MSLINDALKRATQAQPAVPPPAQTSAPMEPAVPVRPPGTPAYFVPVLLVTLSLSCWFLVKAWDTRRSDKGESMLATTPRVVMARELRPPPEDTASPVPVPDSSAPDAAAAATGNESAPLEPPKPAFKLQGIFYRPSRPSAVVNTKTVFIGDRIAGAKVKRITMDSVTLEIDGRTEVLTLP